ncbi:SDR family NAD(P)-dependent oxidoreductase [Sneathiella sp.]|jgi:NAD(P)-dependent dehydrogenase (short-subunit alcohol dehydrogenase family)|uniref:SDR family NAD(P)-dependent oxidoreductase n=1 Tax=Sneathiella sp. TaxID=1964365 RepID=UPI0039E56FFC
MRHTGQIALVTGGAQGIGQGIVEILHQNGASVAIVDIQKDKAEQVAQKLSTKDAPVIAIEADIMAPEGCKKAIQQVEASLGGLDILVNNAAVARKKEYIGKLAGTDWNDHSKLVLEAAVHLADYATPLLKKSGHGAILNVSSVTALRIAHQQTSWAYHVSKAGLEQLTRYLAVKLGPDNIRVNAVAPGLVNRSEGVKLTDFPENVRIVEQTVPLRRVASASDIGKTVSFLCSDDASYITGQVLTIDGGLGLTETFGTGLALSQALASSD